MGFWEADSLLAEYVSVSNPFAFASCWRVVDSRVEGRSIRRPAALSRGVRGSANRFTQCAIRLSDGQATTLCRARLAGPLLNILSVEWEAAPGEWKQAATISPQCFKWLSAISLQSSFPSNPLRDWHVLCMAGRHGMAVYAIGMGVTPDRFKAKSLPLDSTSGVWISELLDLESEAQAIWLDVSVSVRAEAKLAVLQAPRSRVEIYSLDPEESTLSVVAAFELVSLEAQKSAWRAEDELAPVTATLVQMKLGAEVDIAADELQTLTWGGSDLELYIAGRKLWRLDLQTHILVSLYPPTQDHFRESVQRYSDEIDTTDFGFTAMALHPEHSDVLAVVSAVSHMALILSLGHCPPQVLAAVPMPDVYKSSSYHFDALWLDGALAGLHQPPGHFLIVAPSTTFQDGLKAITPVVWFGREIFEDRVVWDAHDQEAFRNPFAFCIHEFSPLPSISHSCPGLLRGPGDCALTATRQRNATVGYHLWLVESSPPNVSTCVEEQIGEQRMWPAPGKLSTPMVDSARVRSFLDREYAKLCKEPKVEVNEKDEVCPQLLDALIITEEFESWNNEEETDKHPHHLALPRPACGCGLSGDYRMEFQRDDLNEPDLIGPLHGVYTYCPGTEPSAADALVVPFSAKASLPQREAGAATSDAIESCAKVAGVCAFSRHWNSQTPPAVELRPRKRRTFDPMGLPVNESMIKALQSSWRLPAAEKSVDESEPKMMPVWLNLKTPAKRKIADETAQAATFRELMSSQLGSSQASAHYDELAEGGDDAFDGDDDN